MEQTLVNTYSVRKWENTDQKNSEYGHFSCSVNSVDSVILRFY